MDALEGWSDFNVAMAGATAALAGLVIVAASVNIAQIVETRSLTSRLGAAIASLVLALVGAAAGLVPEIELVSYGWVMIVGAAGAALFAGDASRQVYANHHPENRAKAAKSAATFLTPVVYAAGGVLLVTGQAAGLAVIAVGAFVAIVTALLASWVVLVEVLR